MTVNKGSNFAYLNLWIESYVLFHYYNNLWKHHLYVDYFDHVYKSYSKIMNSLIDLKIYKINFQITYICEWLY